MKVRFRNINKCFLFSLFLISCQIESQKIIYDACDLIITIDRLDNYSLHKAFVNDSLNGISPRVVLQLIQDDDGENQFKLNELIFDGDQLTSAINQDYVLIVQLLNMKTELQNSYYLFTTKENNNCSLLELKKMK